MTANKSEITISEIISTYNHSEWLEKVLWGYEVLRYSAIAIHLDHKRGYKTQESIDKIRSIRKATKTNKSTFTPYGAAKNNEG